MDVGTAVGWIGGAVRAFRGRTRIRVWHLTEHFGGQIDRELRMMGGAVPPDEIRFEVENVGTATSLQPTVVLTGYLPKPRARGRRVVLGRRRSFTFRIPAANRHLPPHTAIRLTAQRPTEDV